jgi:uncharacterized OB-fold protein
MPEKNMFLSISSGEAEQPFAYMVGKHGSKFLTELRDNKTIYGIRCPKCTKVYVPPRRVCGECFVAMEELVELSGKGTVETFTVLSFGFVDPDTGKQRPVPYTWASVKLDGSDNTFVHFLEETDIEKLKIGMRVQVVFEAERRGHLLDIRHFETINE